MNELQDQLIRALNDLIGHLNQYGEVSWSVRFTRVRDLIDHGDRRGLDHLGQMRGGMGSFFDLVICQLNGHRIESHEEDWVNEELSRLGTRVFSLTDQLKKELN